MVKGKLFSNSEKNIILRMRSDGIPFSTIAFHLNRSEPGVRKFYIRNAKNISHSSPLPPARKPLLSERSKRAIAREVRKNRRTPISEITKNINETLKVASNISTRTVQRALHSMGYHSRAGKRKPLVSLSNRKKRIRWSRGHLRWSNSQWRNVIWSDESRFSLFGSDGPARVWRKSYEKYFGDCLIPKVKKSPSVMVWSFMTFDTLGPLIIMDENINSKNYIQILEENIVPFINNSNRKESFIFQQDNAPAHKASKTLEWFKKNNIKVMDWPPNSPDLNPIENVWWELEKAVRDHIPRPTNLNDLKNILFEEWQKLPEKKWKIWIEKMPHRIRAVIKSKGFPTKY